MPSWTTRTGFAASPMLSNTRAAIPAGMSWIRPVSPPAAAPASLATARGSPGRSGRGLHPGIRLREPPHALLDLRGRHAGVREPQRGVATLEHEVTAFDELHVARRRGLEQSVDVGASRKL